ncbi:Sirtuin family [Penicillium riverlandense]|uniref:Sirtuin family n=1 Tax=Penicillium riverlandense TaxID=1903569 RepID=UPI0025467E24|nr:Sirtuin family [Penicillium riverlandense]KAJ5819603.1 Sirtuin family [Penicillium riverlandense]
MSDPSYGVARVSLWTSVESCCSIIAACLPTLGPLIIRVFRLQNSQYNKEPTSSGSQPNKKRIDVPVPDLDGPTTHFGGNVSLNPAGRPWVRTLGLWKNQHYYKCKMHYPDDLMKKAITAGEVPYCLERGCYGVVKPDIVFFGQNLPAEFEEKEKQVHEADLMLVMGTSLNVAPCSRLPRLIKEDLSRVMINMEISADMETRGYDVYVIGTCDNGVRNWRMLSDGPMNWNLWNEVLVAKGDESDFDNGPSPDECIGKMTSEMKDGIKTSGGHRRMLEDHLGNKPANIMDKAHRLRRSVYLLLVSTMRVRWSTNEAAIIG